MEIWLDCFHPIWASLTWIWKSIRWSDSRIQYIPHLLDFRSFLRNSEIRWYFSSHLGFLQRDWWDQEPEISPWWRWLHLCSYQHFLLHLYPNKYSFWCGCKPNFLCIMLVPLECAELAGICTKWFGNQAFLVIICTVCSIQLPTHATLFCDAWWQSVLTSLWFLT